MAVRRVVYRFADVASPREDERKESTAELSVVVQELLSPQYGVFVWPAARLLALYLFGRRHELEGKRVLELGAGTALPGVLAAKCGATVTLTDSLRFARVLPNCSEIARLNGVHCTVTNLSWGEFPPHLLTASDPAPDSYHSPLAAPFDILIGADVFYDSEDYDDLLATVRFLFDYHGHVHTEFITSYQERSSNPSISPLLSKWELCAERVAFEADYSKLAMSPLRIEQSPADSEDQSESERCMADDPGSFSVELVRITFRPQ
jgi:predicted nicotinamide N-methyase